MPSQWLMLVDFVFVVSLLMVRIDAQCSNCVEVHKCPLAWASVRLYGGHTLERCGWNGKIEKVCCTADPDISDATSSSEDGNIWEVTNNDNKGSLTHTTPPTNKPNKPRDTIRKSEEVCQTYVSKELFTVNWHIYGGEDAEPGEFPHMVALGYPDPDALDASTAAILWNCAGSLISDRYVLTAAHCVLRSKPTKVLAGTINIKNRTSTDRIYDVELITLHPEYVRRTGSNDLALIRTTVVTFTDLVFPACLYQKSNDPIGLVITGWGKIYIGQETRSDVLQKARVAAVKMDTCNATYIQRLKRQLGPGQICAGPDDPLNPTDSCQGDSGGPLQVLGKKTYDIVGIVSFGLTDCGGNAPSVYTRVSNYLDWIEEVVWP